MKSREGVKSAKSAWFSTWQTDTKRSPMGRLVRPRIRGWLFLQSLAPISPFNSLLVLAIFGFPIVVGFSRVTFCLCRVKWKAAARALAVQLPRCPGWAGGSSSFLMVSYFLWLFFLNILNLLEELVTYKFELDVSAMKIWHREMVSHLPFSR